MANSRSARKRIRANERKHVHNRGIRSAVRTRITRARRALLTEDEGSLEQVRSALSSLDRAASKGVLHPNNAARRKSRLMSMLNRLTAAEGDTAAARSAAAGGQKGRSTKAATGKAATGKAKTTTRAAASSRATTAKGARPAPRATAAKTATRAPRKTSS